MVAFCLDVLICCDCAEYLLIVLVSTILCVVCVVS